MHSKIELELNMLLWIVQLLEKRTFIFEGAAQMRSVIDKPDVKTEFCLDHKSGGHSLWLLEILSAASIQRADTKQGLNITSLTTFSVLFGPGKTCISPLSLRLLQVTSALQRLPIGPRAQWQFEGNNGNWYEYKRKVGSE